jgi:hypothetical protein
MTYIVLNPEQVRVLEEACEPVEVRDEQGRVLARILSPADAAVVEEAKRRLATPGPRYSSAEVQARLRKLEEISQREELDEVKVREYLRRMRAGEEV